MRWTAQKRKTVESTAKGSTSKGVLCLFIPLSDTEGVKLYRSATERNQARELQRDAHNLGFGPAVGEDCEMPFLQSWPIPHWWKYDPDGELRRTPPSIVYGYITERAHSIGKLSEQEYSFLTAAMEELGASTMDLHEQNVGKIGDWPVCIDFDPVNYSRYSR